MPYIYGKYDTSMKLKFSHVKRIQHSQKTDDANAKNKTIRQQHAVET